jgi:L-lactate dehydrogenase complex protein LldF
MDPSSSAKHQGMEDSGVIESYKKSFSDSRRQYANEQLLKQRAFYARNKALEHLDKYLLDFEGHLNKNQGKILWAPTAEAGRQELLASARVSGKVITHQHRLLEEMGLLADKPAGWDFLDKDYYTYSEKNEVFPDWRKSRKPGTEARSLLPGEEDCAVLFPEFYISENGFVVLAANDPLIQQCLAGCGKVIFVLGLEQLCISMADSELLLSLQSVYKYGIADHSQYIYTSGSLLTREQRSSKEIQVLILDNGRTDLLAEIPQRQALYCIHCGACTQNSNRFSLDKGKFTGVINAIKAPWLGGFGKYSGLGFEFPLSGRASLRCPVNINLKNLVLENRRQAIERKSPSRSDHLAWMTWKTAMMNRRWLNKGAGMKNFTLKSFFRKQWGESREFPKIRDRSFNEWWIQTRGKNEI